MMIIWRPTLPPKAAIVITAVILTLLVSLGGYEISLSQFHHQPLWAEHWGRHFNDGSFLHLANSSGRMEAIGQAIVYHDRHLLHLLIPLAVYPSLLMSPAALMFITVPALAILLVMTGIYIWSRSSHLLSAIAGMVTLAAAPGLLNRLWGVGSPVQDIPAALLFAAGIFCLLLPENRQDVKKHLTLAAILLCASILTRTPALFISAFTLALIAGADILIRKRSGESFGSTVIPWSKLALGIAVIVAVPIIASFDYLWAYYTRLKPADDQFDKFGYYESTITIGRILYDFFGPALSIILCTLALYSSYRIARNFAKLGLTALKHDALLLVWVLGLPIMLITNKYWSAMPKELLYSIPALIALAFSSLDGKWISLPKSCQSAEVQMFAGIIIGALLVNYNYERELARTHTTGAFEQQWSKNQQAMAKTLAEIPGDLLIWQSYTLPDWWADVTSLAFIKYGVVRIPAGHDYFANQQKYWTAHYRGFPESEIPELVYRRTVQCVDVAVVLHDPEIAPKGMKDNLARAVAKHVSSRMASDPAWKLHSTLSGEPWGAQLAIYVKGTRSAPACYQNALLGLRPDTGVHRFKDWKEISPTNSSTIR